MQDDYMLVSIKDWGYRQDVSFIYPDKPTERYENVSPSIVETIKSFGGEKIDMRGTLRFPYIEYNFDVMPYKSCEICHEENVDYKNFYGDYKLCDDCVSNIVAMHFERGKK